MELSPFRIERFYARYEHSTRFMLSSSDCESRTIGALLELEPGAREQLLKTWCGYTEPPGGPGLRQAIASLYERTGAGEVIATSCAEEGIFLLYHALLRPGDHVIVETPCYESALQVARSTGAEVSQWKRRYEDGWAHDIDALATLKDYTTICASAPSEFLTALALRHRQVLVDRNLEIVRRNLPLLDGFFARHAGTFAWTRPTASPIGFPRVTGLGDLTRYCEQLAEAGVLLLPGSVYDQPDHVRIGFGRANMPDASPAFRGWNSPGRPRVPTLADALVSPGPNHCLHGIPSGWSHVAPFAVRRPAHRSRHALVSTRSRGRCHVQPGLIGRGTRDGCRARRSRSPSRRCWSP
jgi:DNA-binding transcriptional MocR family regulator